MKVLEALGAGKALVATPRAAEGVDALAGTDFLLANGDRELVASLTQLLLDPDRRRAMGEGARAWAERNLSWDQGVTAFERLYDSLTEARDERG